MVARSFASIPLALLLAACGASAPSNVPSTSGPTGAQSSVPSVTLAPTAEPTAAPDVAALFATAADQLASGRLTYTGDYDDGTASTPISGLASWDTATNQTRIQSGVDGPALTSVETLRVDSTWRRRNDGPWVKVASAAASPLVAQLQAAAKLPFTDTGTDAAGNHTLTPNTAVEFEPATFLPGAAAVDGEAVAFVFVVDGQGHAVKAILQLTFGAAKVDVEIAFADLGAGSPAAAPAADDVWAVFTSSRWDASIAHPKGWKYEKGSDYDAWLAPKFDFFSFGRDAVSADADKEATKEFNLQKGYFNGKGTMVDFVLDGVAGHLITVKGRDSYYSANVVVYEVIAQVGKKLYWIYWESKQGDEDADLATFLDIVSTFSFVP